MHLARRGFTLIELLVVVGILAVLIAILLPSLGRSREQAKRTVCLTNIRALAGAVMMYAQQNEDQVPQHAGNGYSLWDIPSKTRDEISALGAGRKVLYCPTNWEHNTDPNWNRGANNDSYIGYDSFMKRIGGNYPVLPPTTPMIMNREPKLEYRTRVLAQKFPQMAELAMDAVIGNGPNPTKFIDVVGNQGIPRSTNHMDRATPFGANVVYMDGHAEPLRWSDMKRFYVVSSNLYFFLPGK